jgi:hypothetical protein
MIPNIGYKTNAPYNSKSELAEYGNTCVSLIPALALIIIDTEQNISDGNYFNYHIINKCT